MKAACYMEQLPSELKQQIMGYLAAKDLARLACVSCEWRRLTPSSNSGVWKNLIMGYLGGKDLARLACVSCEWRRLTPSSNSEVWKNLCHADKNWVWSRRLFLYDPSDDNKWTWKDLFGFWTICGLKYYNWILMYVDRVGAEQGLHNAMKIFKQAKGFPRIGYPNYYGIYPSSASYERQAMVQELRIRSNLLHQGMRMPPLQGPGPLRYHPNNLLHQGMPPPQGPGPHP